MAELPDPRRTWHSRLIRWIAAVGVGTDNRRLRIAAIREKPQIVVAITNWNNEVIAQILVPPDQLDSLQMQLVDALATRKLLDSD